MAWQKVCETKDVKEDLPKYVKVNNHEIAIFLVSGDYYATEAICPHAYALLTEGFIDGETVECAMHEAIFDIPSGELLSGPGCRNLITYPTRIDGNNIEIDFE